jgi:ATP-dependent Lon protease
VHRQRNADVSAALAERAWKGSGDVAKPTHFRQRTHLSRGKQDIQAGLFRSVISLCVSDERYLGNKSATTIVIQSTRSPPIDMAKSATSGRERNATMPRRRSPKTKVLLMPLLPRRRGLLYPNTTGAILIGRKTSLRAVDAATNKDASVAVITQRDPSLSDITAVDVYPIATEATIQRALRLPDGTTQVWVQAGRRLRLLEIVQTDPYYVVQVEPVDDGEEATVASEALRRAVLALFEKVARLAPSIPEDAFVLAMNIEEPGALADFVASTINLDDEQGADILATLDVRQRLEKISIHLAKELDVLELQGKIHSRVQEELDKSQREYFLREQMKAIQRELGETDPAARDAYDMRERIAASGMPDAVRKKAEDELRRMEGIPSASPEVGVIRNYLDWLTSVPWEKMTDDNLDLDHAANLLDEHHYGLAKVKERILEFMAVRTLAREKHRSPILCFVGPPGVGKTSLGRSIAEALGRKFVRVSLGGIRDEAEIRGHRRTYVGALPGRIIHGMKQAGTINPLFMLDEIDKLGTDFRGDPSSALLEVLDPEQNHAFSDHYLDVDYDLSKVMFIATANILDPVIPALRDRMEVIELPGYIEEEKLHIAQQFLIPKQLQEHGLSKLQLGFTTPGVRKMIRGYTREAGVRNLEREIGGICRKVARRLAGRTTSTAPTATRATRKTTPQARTAVSISNTNLEEYLGPPKFFWGAAEEKDQVGVATGVARTELGGDVLGVEVTLMPGKGNLTLTGQLGDVMRESAQAALSYARSRSTELGIAPEMFEKTDIHVHVPAGAVPKEGPSAGITIATALISALTKRPISRHVAMTGEITLRGRVLPVGGLKEKILAAHRAGIKTFVLPRRNEKDLSEVPAPVLRDLRFVFAGDMADVLEVAFQHRRPGP